MGILTLNLVEVHLIQLLLLFIIIVFVSYSSGYMQQIGTFCRSQTRQTLTTPLILYPLSLLQRDMMY